MVFEKTFVEMVPKLQSCPSCEEAVCSPMHPWTSWQLCGCIFLSSVEKNSRDSLVSAQCSWFLQGMLWQRSGSWTGKALQILGEAGLLMKGGNVLSVASALGATYTSHPFGVFPFLSLWFDSHREGSILISISHPAHSKNMTAVSLGHVDVLSHNQDVYRPSHIRHILTTPSPSQP